MKTGRTQEEIAQDLPPKKKKETAARKKKADALSPEDLPNAKAAPMPGTIQPMLATPTDRPPDGAKWIYEIKWDGVRAICYIEDGHLRMVSRNGNSFDRQYPELSVIPHQVAADTAILDAEIAVLDEQGGPRFGLIQPRIHQTNANEVAHLSRKTPVKLGRIRPALLERVDLRDTPLMERKRALSEIVTPSERTQVSDHFAAKGEEMLEAARQMDLEGIMAKDATSEIRTEAKPRLAEDQSQRPAGVCDLRLHSGERATFSSLVLGLYDDGKLKYVGCVGTGFDDKTLNAVYRKLNRWRQPRIRSARRSMCPPSDLGRAEAFVRGEVRRMEQDGRLRAPVFLGLRDDKPAEEAVREELPNEAKFPSRARKSPFKSREKH